MRIVFTLTTLPTRISDIMPTLKSLINQTISPDNIYLTIPSKCKRLNKKYPPIPSKIRNICEIVYVDKDYGPITKILGGIIREKDPDTLIISVDDDIIYPNTLIEEFIKYHELYPNSALGSSGLSIGYGIFKYSLKFNQKKNNYWFTMSVPKEGRKTDILYGYSGILYRRGYFPTYEEFKYFLEEIDTDKDLFRNDDVTLSFYLHSRGIERRIVNMPEVINKSGNNALSEGTLSFFKSLNRAIEKCRQMGWWDGKICKIYYKESLGCLVFSIVLILLFLFIFLIIYMNL